MLFDLNRVIIFTPVDMFHIVDSFWIWPMLYVSFQTAPWRMLHCIDQFCGSLPKLMLKDLVYP